ncbi:MAG TPA: creatininase family protein, partial [Ramlibacter sp.]
AAANFPPPFPIRLLSPDGRPACAWTARDFGPSGVIGDPTSASREQGLEILDTLADSWVQALTELHALRWVVREEATWERGHQRGFIQGVQGTAFAG